MRCCCLAAPSAPAAPLCSCLLQQPAQGVGRRAGGLSRRRRRRPAAAVALPCPLLAAWPALSFSQPRRTWRDRLAAARLSREPASRLMLCYGLLQSPRPRQISPRDASSTKKGAKEPPGQGFAGGEAAEERSVEGRAACLERWMGLPGCDCTAPCLAQARLRVALLAGVPTSARPFQGLPGLPGPL